MISEINPHVSLKPGMKAWSNDRRWRVLVGLRYAHQHYTLYFVIRNGGGYYLVKSWDGLRC